MAHIIGHGNAKYTTGTRLATSRDRNWRGVLAELWRHEEGDLGEVEPRDTEIIVLMEGHARTRRRGDGRLQYHDAKPGTVWLCPAGIREDMIHIYGHMPECLHMYIPATPLSLSALEELNLDPDKVGLQYDGGFHDPLIEQIGRSIRGELVQSGVADRLLVETLATALAVQILRQHSGRAPTSMALARAPGALDARRLEKIRDYVEAHLESDLALDEMARQVCLSPYHFARAFRAATGVPPHRYVITQRIERAKYLLTQKSLTLADISLACGFSSQAHFTTTFKAVTGTTPGAYRALVG